MNKLERIARILEQIDRFQQGDFQFDSTISGPDDDINAIAVKLRALGHSMRIRTSEMAEKKNRIDNLLGTLVRYTTLNFSLQDAANHQGDEVDSLSLGLKTLARELTHRTTRLNDSEEQIETIFKNAPDAVIVINSEGVVVRWNPAAEKLFGWEEQELQGQLLHEFLIPERYRLKHIAGLKNFLKTGEGPVLNRTVQLPALRRDKPEVEVELTISPAKLRDEYLFIAFIRDVTERKKAEELILQLNATLEQRVNQRTEELFESEKKYRNLFENNPMPMWVLDLKSLQFLDVNDAALLTYGYTREEFLSMSALDIRPEEDKERFLNLDRRGQGTRKIGVWRHIKKDGTMIYAEVSVHEISFDGKSARLVLSNDVTEKRKAEEALRFSEARFRKIFESKLTGFVFWDAQGNIAEANDFFLEMIGYTREELLAGKVHWRNITPIEYSDIDDLALRQIKLTGTCEPFEKEYFRKDGSRLPVLIGAAALDETNPENGIAYVVDISQRKKMQEEILELNKDLEQRVARRTEELQLANKELESFTYTVSHDLRAPLRAILGYTQILFEDHEASLNTEAIKLLNAVTSNAKRMGQLVDDLLDFSRMRRSELVKVTTSVDKIVEDVVRELIPPQSRVSVKIGYLGYAKADTALLRHVFQNLISNAIKYSEKKDNPTIEISCNKNETGENVYFVRDNGAGFDMAYYNKLFGVFQRLHRQDEFEGTGVGLAIVERIISRHGGKVWAEGIIDKGATFYFTLNEYYTE